MVATLSFIAAIGSLLAEQTWMSVISGFLCFAALVGIFFEPSEIARQHYEASSILVDDRDTRRVLVAMNDEILGFLNGSEIKKSGDVVIRENDVETGLRSVQGGEFTFEIFAVAQVAPINALVASLRQWRPHTSFLSYSLRRPDSTPNRVVLHRVVFCRIFLRLESQLVGTCNASVVISIDGMTEIQQARRWITSTTSSYRNQFPDDLIDLKTDVVFDIQDDRIAQQIIRSLGEYRGVFLNPILV